MADNSNSYANQHTCFNENRLSKLEAKVEEHDDMLSENKAQFATITTKLNMIMGILGTIGAGLAGIVLKLIFG